jgi:hypothetical protein
MLSVLAILSAVGMPVAVWVGRTQPQHRASARAAFAIAFVLFVILAVASTSD